MKRTRTKERGRRKSRSSHNNGFPRVSYDVFFKKMMKDSETAKEFFSCHLPSSVKELINLKELSKKPQEYISHNLRLKIGDLLFGVPSKEKEGPYFILYVEQQTQSESLLTLRMWSLSLALMSEYVENGHPPPVVIPLVVSNGKRPYCHSLRLLDLYKSPYQEVMEDVFNKSFHLLDISRLSHEEIDSHGGSLAITELAFKEVKKMPFKPLLFKCLKYFKRLLKKKKMNPYQIGDIFHNLVCFLINTGIEVPPKKALMKYLSYVEQQLPKQIGDYVMTLRGEMIKVGVDIGRKKGKSETLKQVIKSMIKEGLSYKTILACTGIDRNSFQKIVKSFKKMPQVS